MLFDEETVRALGDTILATMNKKAEAELILAGSMKVEKDFFVVGKAVFIFCKNANADEVRRYQGGGTKGLFSISVDFLKDGTLGPYRRGKTVSLIKGGFGGLIENEPEILDLMDRYMEPDKLSIAMLDVEAQRDKERNG